jgi:O-antigen/teichoic acid export membrane protein
MNEPGRDGPNPPQEVPAGLAGTVLRGAGLGGLGYGTSQALTLGIYVVLARLISPEEFGDFAAATVLIGFTLLITETGMMSAIVQRRDRVSEAANTAFLATLVSGIGFTGVLLALSPLIGDFFDSQKVQELAAATSGLILLRTVNAVPDGLLWRQFSFVRRLVIEPAQALAFGIAAILAATSDLGAWSLVAGQYASHGVEVILVWTLARWRPRPSQASFGMWRELVGYGRHVFLATTILRAGEQSDAVIVGKILGAGPLGQFRYAYRVASTPFLLILAAASFSIFPAFARIAHDAERMSAAFMRSLRWMMAVAAPAGLFLVPLGLQLTVLVFGDVWRPAGYAAMAMAGFAVGGAVTSLVSELVRSQDRPAALTPMHATTAIGTIVSMALLAQWSLTAAAAGLSIGPLLGAAYGLRVAHGVTGLGVGRLMDAILRPILAAVIMAGSVLAFDRLLVDAAEKATFAGLLWVAIEGLLAIAIYVVSFRLISPETAKDVGGAARGGIMGLRARVQAPARESS